MEIFQHTINKKVLLKGEGILSGQEISVEITPSAPNQGIIFERIDLSPSLLIKVSPETVFATEGATFVQKGPHKIFFIEHLLSALNGLAIDNVLIKVNGPEIPLLDGSARPFVEALLSVGRRPQWSLRRYLRILKELEIKNGVGKILFQPSTELKISCEINFAHPSIGHQRTSLVVTQENYISKISYARTFGFLKDIAQKRQAGIYKGGSLENAIVLDEKRVLNPDGLRSSDEFVRHKALDLVGDLYLWGVPILGEVKASLSSHKLHLQAMKTLLQTPKAWSWFPSPGSFAGAPFQIAEPAYITN